MKAQVVPISIASAAITQLTGKQAPNYRTIWKACVDGDITASRHNGRWFVDPAVTARELGLTGVQATKPAA